MTISRNRERRHELGINLERIAGPYRRPEGRMNAFAKVFGWASIVGALLLFPAVSGAELLGAMRVRLVEGDVQVKIAETGEWAPASVNMPLVEGDELWVPDESLSASPTNNGAYVRLDGTT